MSSASKFGFGGLLLQSHLGTNKMNRLSENSKFFTQAEPRLSTLLREYTAIIYKLTEYEFLILESKYPTVLFTDHKTKFFCFHKNLILTIEHNFQLISMKFLEPLIV